MRVTITGPIIVSTDAPAESADALVRSALEVRLPEHSDDEDERAARILAEWLREHRRAG